MITGLADTFADYADLMAYIKAIADGRTEEEALEVGDDGIGAFGVVTGQRTRAMCALCPEDSQGHQPRAIVVVIYKGLEVECEWQDIRPHRASIKDGSVIELNPAACRQLQVEPPATFGPVQWYFK